MLKGIIEVHLGHYCKKAQAGWAFLFKYIEIFRYEDLVIEIYFQKWRLQAIMHNK